MLMKREVWVGSIAAAVMFLVGVACGGTDNPPKLGCGSDADCTSTQLCHPSLKVCTTACTGSADCPSSAKTCATITGQPAGADGGVKAFCQCSTDALCNGGASGALVCQDTTSKICTAKCTSSSDCGGLACNTTTGKCGSGGGTDGGSDAGMTMDAGQGDAGIDGGLGCDYTMQPGSCGYGSVCNAVNVCDVVTDGVCANITSSGRPAYNAATSTGPVIYTFQDEADDASKCTGTSVPFTVTLYAYAGPNMTFPAQKSNLPGFTFYNPSGTATDIPLNLLQQANYTPSADGKTMSAKFTLCATAGSTNITAGFGFTGGNGFCAALHNP